MISTRLKFFLLLVLVLISVFVEYAEAKKVLLVGDSHIVGTFGETLQKDLALENEVIRYGGKEAKANHFLATEAENRSVSLGAVLIFQGKPQNYKPGERISLPRLNSVLQREHPDAVVISLGDAMAEYAIYRKRSEEITAKNIPDFEKERLLRLNMLSIDQALKTDMKKMKAQVVASGARCIVVTPPLAIKSNVKLNQRVTEISTMIWETMRPECEVVNTSKDLQKHSAKWASGDGLSFDGASGKEWAHAALPMIQKALKEKNGQPKPETQYAYPKGIKDLSSGHSTSSGSGTGSK